MVIVAIIVGLTFLSVGLMIYKNEAVAILAGVDAKKLNDPRKLAHKSGITMIIFGLIFLVEAYVFKNGLEVRWNPLFILILTIFVATAITGRVVSINSKTK